MKTSLRSLHKTFVGKNLVIFLGSLACAFLATFALQYMLIDRNLIVEKRDKLTEWNREFEAKASNLIREVFLVTDFVADTSLATVAINFNMSEQLFARIRALSTRHPQTGTLLFNVDGGLIGKDGVSDSQAQKIVQAMPKATSSCPFWLVFTGDDVGLIKRVRTETDGKVIGFLAATLPQSIVLKELDGIYLQTARQYEEFSPQVEFVPVSSPEVACGENAGVVRTQIKEQKSRFFSLHPDVVVSVILVFLIIATLSSFIIRRTLSQPIEQLVALVRYFGGTSAEPYKGALPDDPMFRLIAEEIISSNARRLSLISENKELEKNTAIARTTQMMAHDVRKPFSLMKSALSVLSHATTIDDVRKNMRIIGPAVERSLTSVNGMLDDIMEIGRAEKPKTEPTSVATLIESSLVEVFHVFAEARISLSYRFGHTRLLNVEASKVQRGISNIVANAVQAMNKQGEIWFATSERNGFIEFKIGNSGPAIPEADLPKLFEAFFSKGKKGGTGLGLAIAKKVVTAHGGNIYCQLTSDKRFVEFVFTLPMGDKDESSKNYILPATSQEVKSIVETQSRGAQASERKVVADPREAEFERKIVAAAAASGRKIEVAILDDEPLYSTDLENLIGSQQELLQAIKISTYETSSALLSAFEAERKPDCLVCDIDLEVTDSLDGFSVVEELRRRKFQGAICIHSNRSSVEDSQKGFGVGADLILPKPMSRAHLLGFIASALGKVEVLDSPVAVPAASKPVVIVADDDGLVLLGWEMDIGSEVEIMTFETSQAVVEKMSSSPAFCSRVVCVISDFWFGKESVLEAGLVAKLRAANYEGPILLSSSVGNEHDVSSFTAVIPKRPMEWGRVRELIPTPRAVD